MLRGALAGLRPELYQATDAARLFEAFAELERLAAAGRTLMAGRVEQTKVWQREGHRTAAVWMAAKTGQPLGQAISTLDTAKRLEALGATRDAFAEGQLSEAQAREVAAAAAADPSAEGGLLDAARTESVQGLRERCRRVRAAALPDEADRYRRIHAGRYLRTWTDPEGAVRLDGRFAPDAGAVLIATVQARQDALCAQARRQGRWEPAAAYAADALVELAAADGSAHGAVGPRAMVHVVVDHAALRRGTVRPGERCEIPGVGPVPVAVADSLAADSILKVLVTKGADVSGVAHAGRTIPARLRTALQGRDPTCVVPGCDVRRPLEIDHITPYADGGRTTADNLVRLCRWHHYLKTHCGYRMRGRPGAWRWVTPDDALGSRAPPVGVA